MTLSRLLPSTTTPPYFSASLNPITLTVDGEPKAILQEPTEYRRLLDLAAEADAGEGIRRDAFSQPDVQ